LSGIRCRPVAPISRATTVLRVFYRSDFFHPCFARYGTPDAMGAVMVDWLWLLAFFWRLTPRSAACPKGKRVYSPIAGVHVIPIDQGPLYLLSRNSREVSSSLVLYRVRSSTGKGEGVALHGAISGLTRWKELQSICDVSAKQNRGARFARGPTSKPQNLSWAVYGREVHPKKPEGRQGRITGREPKTTSLRTLLALTNF